MSLDERLSDVELPEEEPNGYKLLSAVRKYDQTLVDVEVDNPLAIAGSLFAHYQHAVKQLNKLYDEELQPQVGLYLRDLCEAANKRMMELKDNLIQIEMSEYHYLDSNIIQLKLIPKDFEILHLEALPCPTILSDPHGVHREKVEKVFKGERISDEVWKRDSTISLVKGMWTSDKKDEEEEEGMEEEQEEEEKEDNMFSRRRKVKKSESEIEMARPYVPEEPPPPPEVVARMEAIKEIQKHERARQGRLEYFDALQIWQFRNRIRRMTKVPEEQGNKNATTIQKLYRGYIARRDLKDREKRLRLLIGMDMPYWRPHEDFDKELETKEMKRALREERLKEYIESIGRERERIIRVVGPQLAEDIGDEIRYWFVNWYEEADCFDKYPTPEEGGTVLVVRGETLTPKEFLIKREEIRREKERLRNNPGMVQKMKEDAKKAKKAAKEAEKKEKERIKAEAAAERRRAVQRQAEGTFKFLENEGIPAIQKAEENFADKWQEKFDETINPERTITMDPITEKHLYELQLAVREEVDKMMRLELILLEKALCRDLHRKYKKPREKKKKGKAKKVVDEYPGDWYLQVCYDFGIIRPYPEHHLDEFLGEYSYADWDLRWRPGRPLDPPPALGDVRSLIMNTCILPLVGEEITKGKPKSVCIAGPPLSGKKLLLNAICTQTKAILFDISPRFMTPLIKGPFSKIDYDEKTEEKYLTYNKDLDGPRVDGLSLLMPLARSLQPVIFYMEAAEAPFYGRVPKEEKKDEPKRMKKIMQKNIYKKIKPTDKIMIISVTRQPWVAKGRPFIKAYDRFLIIPRTDYGTVFMYWTKLLMAVREIPRDLDISALTKVTVGYRLAQLQEAFEAVVTPRRILQLKYKPFHEKELLEYFLKGKGIQPVSLKEQNQFFDWYNKKVSIGKLRTMYTEAAEAQRVLAELQAAKAAQRK